MAGELKNTLGKATDAIGGTAGKMSASMATGADGFVEDAAIGNRYEMEAARIALKRGRSDEVKSFAKTMIADHTTAKHHLHAALEMNETRGVKPPPGELDTRRRTMIQHLEEAPDGAFDSTYADQQVLAHEETATLMRSFAEGGDNAQLRSFALGTLPVVERHLTRAKAMKAAA